MPPNSFHSCGWWEHHPHLHAHTSLPTARHQHLMWIVGWKCENRAMDWLSFPGNAEAECRGCTAWSLACCRMAEWARLLAFSKWCGWMHTQAHTIPHLPIVAVWTPLPLLTINLPPLRPQPLHHPHPNSSPGDTAFCTRTVTSEPYFSCVNHDLTHPEDLKSPSSPLQLQPRRQQLKSQPLGQCLCRPGCPGQSEDPPCLGTTALPPAVVLKRLL